MDLGIPPLNIKNLTESKPQKSGLSACGLTVPQRQLAPKDLKWSMGKPEETYHSTTSYLVTYIGTSKLSLCNAIL